jgi:hypothetical protein
MAYIDGLYTTLGTPWKERKRPADVPAACALITDLKTAVEEMKDNAFREDGE